MNHPMKASDTTNSGYHHIKVVKNKQQLASQGNKCTNYRISRPWTG